MSLFLNTVETDKQLPPSHTSADTDFVYENITHSQRRGPRLHGEGGYPRLPISTTGVSLDVTDKSTLGCFLAKRR